MEWKESTASSMRNRCVRPKITSSPTARPTGFPEPGSPRPALALFDRWRFDPQ
jgi:hypothetical protein